MSITDAEAKTTPPAAEAAEEVKAPAPTAEGGKEGGGGSSSSGLWGWRNRLMNWRGGSDDKDKEEASAATTAGENTTPSAAATEEGREATTTTHTTATQPAASTTRPMNIWLRRALERQAESAIAEALRDGKPLPTTTTAIPVTASPVPAAAENAKTEPASAAGGVATEASDSINATAVSPAPQRISFADLMRQHREGLLAPSAQPAVKATKVVKKPKTATAAEAASAEAASTTPTSKKRKAKAEAAPATSEGKDETDTGAATTTAAAAALTTAPAKSKSEAGTSVHKGAVHKRVKAASPLNSASARRTQGTSAEVSAAATPTQTTTVKGKLSLEEMRARRNRTTASAHNTPSPLATAAGTAAEDAAGQRVDGYNEGALDAISQLLLRYCLGDPTKTTAGAPAEEAAEATSSELVFFNQLMELCESNSLTPESLELLRELFQHVRVLPRPNTTTTTTTTTTPAAAAETSPDAAVAEEATADAAVAQTTMDAEAYREASRRREYVQQVIMVLINRLKQLKLQEQQREQRRQEHAAVATGAPQAVVGHTMPSIRVGGVPLNPLPTTTTTTTTMPNTTNTTTASATCSSTQPPPPPTPQTSAVPPAMLSYNEQMRHLAEWRAMAELASGDGGADEAAAAAAFASTMAAHGYPNPYAHLTVFSQHQPVAPPVGWPSASTSSSRGGGGPGAVSGAALNNSVAARLMPSPFPGAFPIIPPPSSTRSGANAGDGVDGAGAKEEREMQELFRLIRHQLTQPAHTRSTDAQSTTSPGPAATATSAVDVSQAERAILRHVQQDFKHHQQQQQQQQQSVGNSPAAAVERPTASTPPTTSLDAPSPPSPASHRTLFTPQGKRRDGESEAAAAATAAAGATPPPPSTRSATASPAPEGAEAEKKAEAPASTSAATALNIAAKPFVPGQPAATAEAPAAAKTALNLEAAPFVPAGDGAATPPRTTIRYEAKPFQPGAATTVKGSTAGAAPASTMRAQAKAFVPAPQQQQQQQQSAVSASPAVPSHARNYAAAADMRGANLGGVPGGMDPAADPWASYEMFARWRDMMEVYYQGVFAGQQAANGASSSLATPPRRS